MGLFDKFFGSSNDSETATKTDISAKTDQQSVAVEDKSIERTETTSGVTTQDTTQQQTVTQLDPATQKILQDLIQSLSGGLESGGGNIVDTQVLEASGENIDFANFLSTRAGETEGVLNTGTDAIIAEARRTGENALELQGTQLARGAGSNLNSIVQAANAQGRSDLETQLAAVRANLGIQARQAGSQDLATAFGARNESVRAGADIQIAGQTGGVQNIAAIVEQLVGATTETVGGQQSVGTTLEESQIQELVEAIQAIASTTESQQSSKQIGSVQGDSSPSGFSNIISLLDVFNVGSK